MQTEITTNHHWHEFLSWYDLTEKETLDADVHRDDGIYMRYRGWVYSLDEFMNLGVPDGWHGVHSDSFFSGVLIRVSDDGEMYQIATYIVRG